MKNGLTNVVRAVLCVGMALAGTALPQTPSVTSANGIKLGDARLHPFFDLEFRYDSLAGYFPPVTGGALVQSPEILGHFRPGLRLDLPSDAVALTVAGNVDYVWYTGLLTPGSNSASRLEAAADLNAAFNRKGAVELDLGDHLTRSDQTTDVAIGVGVISLYNDARLAVPIHPGGGALEVTPSVGYGVEFFQPISNVPVPGCDNATCSAAAAAASNYQNLHGGLQGKLKFLPKTALVVEGTFDDRLYFSPGSNPPAELLRGMAGLQGLLTSKIAVIAKVGWGFDFAGSGANTLLAHAEINYIMNEVSSIKGGYLRDLQPVPSYGTYGDDRGYVEARFLFGGRLTLRINGSYDYLTFYSKAARNDSVASILLGPDYQITPWLIVAAGYVLSYRSSNAPAQTNNYTRNEGYLRVTFTY